MSSTATVALLPEDCTCCYAIKCNFGANCVYCLSHLMDAIQFGQIFFSALTFALMGRFNWAGIILLILALPFLATLVLAIMQMVTKSSSAPKRFQMYLKFRKFAIIGILVFALLNLLLWMIVSFTFKSTDKSLQTAFRAFMFIVAFATALPFVVTAIIMYGYHKSFPGHSLAVNPVHQQNVKGGKQNESMMTLQNNQAGGRGQNPNDPMKQSQMYPQEPEFKQYDVQDIEGSEDPNSTGKKGITRSKGGNSRAPGDSPSQVSKKKGNRPKGRRA